MSEKKIEGVVVTGSTTGTATAVLYTYDVPTNAVAYVEATIIGKNSSNGDCYATKKSCIAKNEAGTVSVVGSVQSLISAITDLSLATASCTFDVSGTSIRVKATGVLATTLTWQSYVNLLVN